MWELLIAVIAGSLVKRITAPPGGSPSKWPKKAAKYQALFEKWAKDSGIPIDILLSWAYRESSFNPTDYNPSYGTMQSWACSVANDSKWAGNPDYNKAVQVCTMLGDGSTSAKEIAEADKGKPFGEKLWTFGATGMFQISRITASGSGCLPKSAANKSLLDVDTNGKCACAVIRDIANQMGATKPFAQFTDADWAVVRAGYVLGPRGPKKNPEKAKSIAKTFVASLDKVRAGTV